MNKIVGDIITIILGSGLIIFRDWVAKETIDFQNGAFGSHFGTKELDASKRVIILVGLVAIVGGLASMLGTKIPFIP